MGVDGAPSFGAGTIDFLGAPRVSEPFSVRQAQEGAVLQTLLGSVACTGAPFGLATYHRKEFVAFRRRGHFPHPLQRQVTSTTKKALVIHRHQLEEHLTICSRIVR